MIAFWFVLGVLAVYRAARMIVMEDGPFDLLSTLQNKLGQKTWLGRGLKCFLCVSFWASLVPALLLATDWRQVALLWGGTAGASVLVWKYLE